MRVMQEPTLCCDQAGDGAEKEKDSNEESGVENNAALMNSILNETAGLTSWRNCR